MMGASPISCDLETSARAGPHVEPGDLEVAIEAEDIVHVVVRSDRETRAVVKGEALILESLQVTPGFLLDLLVNADEVEKFLLLSGLDLGAQSK